MAVIHTPTNSRETWIDVLRGIAIILVVILHAGLALQYYADSYPALIRSFNDAFEPFRMPTLVFLTGLFVTRSVDRGAAHYFAGKARSVAWPYFVWTIITFAASGDLTLRVLAKSVYDPEETHLWYLWFLILFYAAAWALCIARVPAWAPAVAALIISHWMPAETFRLEKMFFLFGFFMLGVAYSQHRTAIDRVIFHPVVLVVATCGAMATSAMNLTAAKVLYEPIYAVGVCGALIIAMWLTKRLPTSAFTASPGNGRRGILEYVGFRSIVFYVSHLLAIKVVGTVLDHIGVTNPWISFPLLVTAGLGAGALLAFARDRYTVARLLFEFPSRARSSASTR